MSHATTHPGGKTFQLAVDAASFAVAGTLAYTLFVHLHWASDSHEEVVEKFDLLLTSFFALDLIVRFVGEYDSARSPQANVREFLSDKWNIFDTVLITLALAPLVLAFVPLGAVQTMLLRGFRAARIFHGVKHVHHFGSLRVMNAVGRVARLARTFHGVKHVGHLRLPAVRLPSVLRKR